MRLADLQSKKQDEALKQLEGMRQERKEAELARVKKLQDEQARSAKNWEEETISGASLGMSVGGPMGALIGAIGGAAYGQYQAIEHRMEEEDQGFWEAFGKTHLDNPFFNVGEAIDAGSFEAGREGAMGLPGEEYMKTGLAMGASAAGEGYENRQAKRAEQNKPFKSVTGTTMTARAPSYDMPTTSRSSMEPGVRESVDVEIKPYKVLDDTDDFGFA